MWYLQQQENSYCHTTRLNRIGSQTTSKTPQNGQLYDIRICKLGDGTKMFKNMGYEVALVERQRIPWSTESIFGQRNEQWRQLFYKTSPPNSPSSNLSSLYTYLKLSENSSSEHMIMQGCVEPSPGYSFLYRIPDGDTIKNTVYDREMSYDQTVTPSQTTHNVAY